MEEARRMGRTGRTEKDEGAGPVRMRRDGGGRGGWRRMGRGTERWKDAGGGRGGRRMPGRSGEGQRRTKTEEAGRMGFLEAREEQEEDRGD